MFQSKMVLGKMMPGSSVSQIQSDARLIVEMEMKENLQDICKIEYQCKREEGVLGLGRKA